MLDPAAPPNRVGAETTIMWRDDTVVATVLETFDELWAQAQGVAASDRLVIELAAVELIIAIRAASHRGTTIHLALEVDEIQVSASLTHAGTAAALTGTEFAQRYGLGARISYRHTPSGSVARITHTLRQSAALAGAGAQVRKEDAADRLGAAHPLTRTSPRPNMWSCRMGAALPATDPGLPTLTPSPLGQSLGIEPTRSPARRNASQIRHLL